MNAELISREYSKEETVETFETVLFVAQVAKDVSKACVHEVIHALYLIEKIHNLDLSKNMDTARFILRKCVMYN